MSKGKNIWENARYLIDAKKDIDSIIFIRDNLLYVSEAFRYDYICRVRENFYINLCIVLDKYKSLCGKKEIKDSVVKGIYYERNKNAAHSDYNYRYKNYSTLNEMIHEMKVQIKKVKTICQKILPPNITLDFVSHDKVLFRLLYRVDYYTEEKLKDIKHLNRRKGIMSDTKSFPKTLLSDIKELRGLSKEQIGEYAVQLNGGLNIFEGIQNRQDFSIQINVAFGLNTWCSFRKQDLYDYKYLRDSGFLDVFDIPRNLKVYSMQFLERVQNIFNKR